MRRLFRTGILFWLTCIAASRGEEPSSRSSSPPSVQQLIEQLGSDNFRVRETASNALKARGAKALPLLREARKHPDLEIRRRVAELLPVMEKAVALAPTRLSLHLTDRLQGAKGRCYQVVGDSP